MIPLIIAIVTFYALIPVLKTMDMKRPITFTSIFQSIRNGFKYTPDVETLAFQADLDQLSGKLQNQRSQLSTVTGVREQNALRQSLEETRTSLVHLVRKFELEMSDEEYEQVIQLISSENDPAGTPTRIYKEAQDQNGAVRVVHPNAIG